MFYKCCIDDCSSRRRFVKMHKFPTSETQLNTWLQSINSDRLNSLSMAQLRKCYVCHIHFERRFCTDTSRLRLIAYPALFMQDEIASGIPTFRCKNNSQHITKEHSYIKRRQHEDHTYCGSSTPNHFIQDAAGKAESIIQPAPGTQTPSDTLRATQSTDEPANDGDMNNGIELSDDFEEPVAAVFSWQKNEILYPTEDCDVLMCPKVEREEALGQEIDLSLYDEDPPDKHSEYQCNECRNEIVGFRYTCVQCPDWDLCGACEGSAAHATHYVLRVPGPRPYNEIQTVLAAIRQQLLSENLFLPEQMSEDRVKSEPEDEAPRAARDPLLPPRAPDRDTDGSQWSRRKRRRRRCRLSDADDSSDSDTVSDDTSVDSGSAMRFNNPGHLLYHRKPDRLPSNIENTERNPVTCSESIQPILEIDTDSLEQPSFKSQEEHPEDIILGIPDTIYEVPADVFGVPGYVFQVPSDLFGHPDDIVQVSGDIFQVSDDATVYAEETPSLDAFSIDPLSTGVEEVDSNLKGNGSLLYLRVPSDTNDEALAQALQSQAYVAMQPLAIEELRGAKR